MKQWDMRFNYKDPRVEFVIGDVRDKDLRSKMLLEMLTY